MSQELFTPKQLKPTKMQKINDRLNYMKAANISVLSFDAETGQGTFCLPNLTPYKGKFSVAYHCPSSEKDNKKPWRIELKTGQYVKWVWTRDEAKKCIDDFEKR